MLLVPIHLIFSESFCYIDNAVCTVKVHDSPASKIQELSVVYPFVWLCG